MTHTRQRIATELERAFAEAGFAEQGVEALRAEADVSLRTLYKYFPSREAMIVGALEYRDRTYFEWLAGGPETGVDHVLHPLVRLGDWLSEVANTGCLFLTALSEYPDSAPIAAVVTEHKSGSRTSSDEGWRRSRRTATRGTWPTRSSSSTRA